MNAHPDPANPDPEYYRNSVENPHIASTVGEITPLQNDPPTAMEGGEAYNQKIGSEFGSRNPYDSVGLAVLCMLVGLPPPELESRPRFWQCRFVGFRIWKHRPQNGPYMRRRGENSAQISRSLRRPPQPEFGICTKTNSADIKSKFGSRFTKHLLYGWLPCLCPTATEVRVNVQTNTNMSDIATQ
jgi:hypothetical protein